EQILDLTLGRTNTSRRNQNDFRKDRRIVRGHFGSDPSAERKPDYVDRREILLAHEARNKAPEIADVHYPVGERRAPESGIERSQQSSPLAQRTVPFHPARISQLFVQYEERLPRSAFQHDQLISADLVSFFAHRIVFSHIYLARSHTDRIIDDRTIDRVASILQVRT